MKRIYELWSRNVYEFLSPYSSLRMAICVVIIRFWQCYWETVIWICHGSFLWFFLIVCNEWSLMVLILSHFPFPVMIRLPCQSFHRHPMTVVMLLSHYGVLSVLRPMKMTQRSWQFLGTSSSAFCFLILQMNIIQILKQLYFNSVLKEQSSFTCPHVVQTCIIFFFPWNTEGQSQWIESF